MDKRVCHASNEDLRFPRSHIQARHTTQASVIPVLPEKLAVSKQGGKQGLTPIYVQWQVNTFITHAHMYEYTYTDKENFVSL